MTGPLNPKVPLATTRNAGLMPKLSGKATDSLGGDGQWRVGSGTGSGPIAESDVTGLTTDLAAKADKATTLTGTGPILIAGDNSPHDLSANRTISLSRSALNLVTQFNLDFFDHNGLLPPNAIIEEPYDYPTLDFEYLNAGTKVINFGSYRLTSASTTTMVHGWDLGAAYDEILYVSMLFRPKPQSTGLFICDTAPSTNDVAGNAYVALYEVTNARVRLYKVTASVFTQLAETVSPLAQDTPSSINFATALYRDNVSNRLIFFTRCGSEAWVPMIDITDATFGAMRYAGVYASSNGANSITWDGCPIAIYVS